MSQKFLLLLLVAGALLVSGCTQSPAPAGGAPAATSAATPAAAQGASGPGGMPFSDVPVNPGDWVKWRVSGLGASGENSTLDITERAVEISFGGVTYSGTESELSGLPGSEAGASEQSLAGASLTEKGNPGGKAWAVSKVGDTVLCYSAGSSAAAAVSTPPPDELAKIIQPTWGFQGTGTYTVPETGQTVQVWKYKVTVTGTTTSGQAAPFSSEEWLSNQVPYYVVKGSYSGSSAGETGSGSLELRGFGSGAASSFTSAQLESACGNPNGGLPGFGAMPSIAP